MGYGGVYKFIKIFDLKKKNFFGENNRKSDKIMHCVEKKNFDWQS